MKQLLKSIILLLICTSCSSTLMQHEAAVSAYKQGQLCQAESILSKTLSKEMPSGNFQKSNEAVCLLLDRATTRFASGNIEDSIQDFNKSLDALDYYAQESTLDITGQILLEDGWGAYKGSDLEHLLARIYFALALMQQGDYNNAHALLRQAEEIQQEKTHQNALGKFLFGTILEHQGDHSNAAILMRQAEELTGFPVPEIDLKDKSQASATVVLICHNGIVPFKISGISPASIASTLALEALLGTKRLDPCWSSISGVPTPILCQQLSSEASPISACINGKNILLAPWFNVARATDTELKQQLPLIVAKGVARYLLRRAAVAHIQKQNPQLGTIADIGMLIANANTDADTRAWSTLPSSIDLARCYLTPGEHCINIAVNRLGPCNFNQNIKLKLRAGDLCVINIFNINPKTTLILVPLQFQAKGASL